MSIAFPGFTDRRIAVDTGAGEVAAWVGGEGPPVLLLHGYPQCRTMWHLVAPRLAETRTVVVADLRGYGDTGSPEPDAAATTHSKRAMAADQVAAMAALGFPRFDVVGHDRGGRVAHRMALDHPDAVRRAAVLDIVPTRTLLRGGDLGFATAYWHWYFLAQGGGLPERMIGGDPEWFVREIMRRWSRYPDRLHPEALAAYVAAFTPRAVAASCADYRAAIGPDLEHDDADADAGRRVTQPLLVLWGAHGAMARLYDVLDTWHPVADRATGRALDSGHFLPEEAPEETLLALREFLSGD
ncbi:MAG: alpha/beta hydrolase [Thermoleophilia bacterium]